MTGAGLGAAARGGPDLLAQRVIEPRPEPEQEDARQGSDRQKRLIARGEAEGGTMIGDELKPHQAPATVIRCPFAERR